MPVRLCPVSIAARSATAKAQLVARIPPIAQRAQRQARPRPAAVLQTHAPLFSTTTAAAMASDDAYAAFLDKANADPGSSTSRSKTAAAAQDHQQNVPQALVTAAQDQFYASDADEPFVAVALPLKGGLPTEERFIEAAGLAQDAQAVSILDPLDWDRAGQYKKLLDAVRAAGEGNDVRVYRVQQDRTRVEYWLVTTTASGQLVGFKAKAIES